MTERQRKAKEKKVQEAVQENVQEAVQENVVVADNGAEVVTPSFTDEYRNAFADTQRNDTTTDVVTVNKAGAETSFLSEDVLKPFVADINRIKACEKASQMGRLVEAATMAHMIRNGAFKKMEVKSAKKMIEKCGIIAKELSPSMCEKLVSVGDKFLYIDDNGETHYKEGIPHLPLSSLMELVPYAIPEKDAFGKDIEDANGLPVWNIQPVRDFCNEHGISSFWSEKRIKDLKQKLLISQKPEEKPEEKPDNQQTNQQNDQQTDQQIGTTATATPPHSRAARLNTVIHGLDIMMTYLHEYGTEDVKKAEAVISAWLTTEKEARDAALDKGESEVWLTEE